MAFTRVHHVGLAVTDLEEAKHVLVDGFGLAIDEHRTPWPGGLKNTQEGAAQIQVPIGELYYEVSAPLNAEGTPAKFLEANGGRPGMWYVSFASSDIRKDVEGLVSRGAKIRGDWSGQGPVFLETASTLGLLLQITPEESYYVHPMYRGNGLIQGMAHIGIAAQKAELTRHLWGDIFGFVEDKGAERGQEPPKPGAPVGAAIDPVHLVEFPLGGIVIETSIPTTTDSGTAKLVASRATMGGTYHHTCPWAYDVHRLLESTAAAGLQQIGSVPPREQTTRVVGWLHPRSCLGMLTELWNRAPGPGHYEVQKHPM